MESDQALSRTIKLLYGIMFIFTGAVVFGFSYFAGKSQEAILRNTIVSLLITGTVIFMLMDAAGRGKEGFYYDNYYKRNRFFVVYMIMIPISCAFSLMSFHVVE